MCYNTLMKFIEKIKTKKSQEPEIVRAQIEPYFAAAEAGLSAEQVATRRDGGWANLPIKPPGKTVAQIVLSNVFTYFNMLFFFLAICVFAVGSWRNAVFLGVVFANMGIGIVQELKAKKTMDKLTVLSTPKGVLVRDGKAVTVPTDEAVRDDIAIFTAGNQIFADAVIVSGKCTANESLITGEAHEIKKEVGSELLSGSFIASGECRARLTNVGADSYVNKLTIEAKKIKEPQKSEMMRSLTKLIVIIGILIIPLGFMMATKEIVWLGRDTQSGVVATVASLVGMIPEGLYLLTSLALTAGVVRLAQKKTLVHDMGCIETLARVDVLCVDKTGTITESKMDVEGVSLLYPDEYSWQETERIIKEYVAAQRADNETMRAIRSRFGGAGGRTPLSVMDFSSAKKYGAVTFSKDESYIFGAPDVMLGSRYTEYEGIIEEKAAKGSRVLLFAKINSEVPEELSPEMLVPIALLMLKNKVREDAPDTFKYFAKQGVAIKVISGDNALAVSEVAKSASIENADKYIDARNFKTDADIAEAMDKYTVFGRVTPEQKKKFVQALKSGGHTVAMTGDGVNDVLALKEADCSIAMAAGSDAACQVSHIVLLNSSFASMPSVVAEGRRVINNIERSASLFLVKNIFSFILAIITLLFTLPYPVTAAQLSLVNGFTIGIPGFILAMEPNSRRISGKFLPNIIKRAAPGGLTNLVLVLGVIISCTVFKIDEKMMGTICTLMLALVGLMVVHRACTPYNLLRKILMVLLCLGFAVSALFLKNLFTLTDINTESRILLVVFGLLAWPVLKTWTKIGEYLNAKYEAFTAHRHKVRKKAKRV